MHGKITGTALLLAMLAGTSLAAERPKFDLRHLSGVVDLTVHPDGRWLASVSRESTIHLWDLNTGRRAAQLSPSGKTVDRRTQPSMFSRRIESIAFSPDGRHLVEAAVEGGDGVLRIWDPKKREPIREIHRGGKNIRAVAFSPDGKMLAANMRDGERSDHKIALFDVEKTKLIGEFRGDQLAATMLAFSPDGKTLITAGGRKLHIWDVETRKERHAISTHKKTILGIAFSPDNEHFASSDADDEVHIWSAETGKLVREIEHKQEAVGAVAYSTTGDALATGGHDGTIKIWSVKGRLQNTLWGHTDRITSMQFTPDNDSLASGSRDGTIAIWEYEESEDDDEDDDDDEGWSRWDDEPAEDDEED